jgi:hypothetical protein
MVLDVGSHAIQTVVPELIDGHDGMEASGWIGATTYLYATCEGLSKTIHIADMASLSTQEVVIDSIEKPYTASILDISNGRAVLEVSNLRRPSQVAVLESGCVARVL